MKIFSKIVVFVLCLFALAVVGCGGNNNNTASKNSGPEIYALSPAGIYPTIFRANEEKFDKLFKGKYVEFSGCVFDIEENSKNACLIFYADNRKQEALIAFLDNKNDPNLAKLRKNPYVVMRGYIKEGKYVRQKDLYGVVANKCVIKDILVQDGFNGNIENYPKVKQYVETHLTKPTSEFKEKNALRIFMSSK